MLRKILERSLEIFEACGGAGLEGGSRDFYPIGGS